MKLLNKFFKKVDVAIIKNPPHREPANIELIEVADLKQYLVEEFEHVKQLEAEIEKMKSDEESFTVLKQKYDVTLTTLDEYRSRNNALKRDADFLKHQLKCEKEKNDILINEINTLKIKINAIYEDTVSETKEKIIKCFSEHKGNLSKGKAIETVENLVIKK